MHPELYAILTSGSAIKEVWSWQGLQNYNANVSEGKNR